MKLPKKVLKAVKENTGATEEEIMDAFKAEITFVVKVIREGLCKSIRLMKFGKFYVDKKRLKKMQERVINDSFDAVKNA